MSISMIDSHRTRGHYKTTALIGGFLSSDQNGSDVRNKLVRQGKNFDVEGWTPPLAVTDSPFVPKLVMIEKSPINKK